MNRHTFKGFISYRRDTARDFALHLKKGAKREGLCFFLDITDIPKRCNGKEWKKYRDEALNNSKMLLLIITEGIENSPEVAKEIAKAMKKHIDLMFLRHCDVESNIVISTGRREINLDDFYQTQFDTKEDLLRKVLREIKKDLAVKNTALQIRAEASMHSF